ncbi:MAG: glycosyltransferase family 4 protein [Bacteroidetes bacterium]|nr:glycosyltransferase family 4 protein [Bacteroidota bacterium]
MASVATRSRHIDVVSKYFYPVAAGIETNVMETYAVLAEMGWDVTIHTSRDVLTKKDVLAGTDVVRNLRVIRYPFTRLGYSPAIDWEMTDVVCLHNFNILPHFRLLMYSLMLKALGKKSFALIVTPHGGFNPEWSIFPRAQAAVKAAYHYTIGTLLINACVDGVRAVSEWEKAQMIAKGVHPRLVTTISNGIEDEAYVDVEAEASPEMKQRVAQLGDYLIQIGRIYPIKNYETTIRALPRLPRNVKFVIVGPVADEGYLRYLKGLAEQLGVGDRVVFFGVVRGVDKYYLIKHAMMMVHMAIWESFCNVVHEGLSQGLVCIVANNTALPYLIKDGVNGYCLDTLDHAALAEKIAYVLSNWDSEEIREMKRRGREFGLQNSWRTVAQKMDALYTRSIPMRRIPATST